MQPDVVADPAACDVVILAGGAGTRLGTDDRPKPLAEIGGRPLLAHVMDHFQAAGFRHFVVALGHGGPAIRRWFDEHAGSFEGDVSLVDTGVGTGTAGRLARLGSQLSSTFMVANADGLSTLDVADMLTTHVGHGRTASVAAVRPSPRFGYLTIDDDQRVIAFAEKSRTDAGWINGGYWALNRTALDRVESDSAGLEQHLAPDLAADGELMAYHHDGCWECVDTPEDLEALRAQWDAGNAPWRAA